MFDENSLSDNEYQIYLFLKKNDISKKTAANIADELFVGRSMVYRVCKKMGYQTFSEYKYAQMMSHQEHEQVAINLGSSLTESDLSDLSLVINELKKARHIYVAATSATAIAAQYLSRQLINLGLFAIGIGDHYELKQRKITFNRGDVILCISNSGKNEDLNGQVTGLEQPLIAITKTDSELHRISDLAIHFNFEDYKYENPFDRENLFPIFIIIQHLLKCLRSELERD